MRLTALASAVQEDLIRLDGVTKLFLSRRTSAVFASGAPATDVYFLESGLVKIEKITDSGKDLLLGVVASGQLFGEQGILGEGVYPVSAKVLEAGIAYSIPSPVFQSFCEHRPELWRQVVQHLITKKGELERKIEHLCMNDVKARIVYYLDELAKLNSNSDARGSVIHISQNELASLVGATRETTSTTLNSLARQGVIVLGHRLVMIPSLEAMRGALTPSNSQPISTLAAPQA